MFIGMAFWIIMLVWAVFGLISNYNPGAFGAYGVYGHPIIIFVLLGLLGWQVFGSALHK